MNIIAVDDERLVLEDLKDICSEIKTVKRINTFSNPADALEFAAMNSDIDVAFLDIGRQLRTLNAKQAYSRYKNYFCHGL